MNWQLLVCITSLRCWCYEMISAYHGLGTVSRTPLSTLLRVVGRMKFPLMLEISTLCISIFWLIDVIIISIFLYSLWSGFRFSRSTSVGDACELTVPVSNSALQVISSTSTTSTGYITGPSPVATISLFGFLSQIELWYLPLHW